ncbi:MAG: prolyl-tRNA synthetase associated domain-containing protein [Kiloniellaceae bacterium]
MSESESVEAALPTPPEALLARLEELGIEARTVTHPPVFTVEEAKALRGELPGSHIKNLFLRNKKGRMWLVTCLEDREVDLKALGQRLEAGRFSFGSAERLMTYLGVLPGSVTPFAVINDTEKQVTMVLDTGVMDAGPVNCHPLVNTMTTAVSPEDLIRFLEAEGHPPQMLDMGTGATGA